MTREAIAGIWGESEAKRVRGGPVKGRNHHVPAYVWDFLLDARDSGAIIPGRILRACAGGASVDVMGVVAFMPKFHSTVSHVPDRWDVALETGETHPIRVIEVDAGNEVVVSRRAALITDDAWEAVRDAHEARKTVDGRIVKAVKNGYIVNVLDAEGYLSDIGLSRELRREGTERLLGREVELKIIRVQDGQRRVVVSQRAVGVSDEMWERLIELRRSQVTVWVKLIDALPSGDGLVDLFGVEALVRDRNPEHLWPHPPWSARDHLGTVIPVRLVDLDEGSRGALASRNAALVSNEDWSGFTEIHRRGDEVEFTVAQILDQGFRSDLGGVPAFLPHSQADPGIRELAVEDQVGSSVRARISGIDHKERVVWLTCNANSKLKQEILRNRLANELLPGQVREAQVKRIITYGAFVDLGGVDALLHRSEMAWYRVDDPTDEVNEGEIIDVKVLSIDEEKGQVSVGRKQLLPDPWRGAMRKYPVGRRAAGKVGRITRYGILVDLEVGVTGLVHQSNIDWSSRQDPPRERGFEPEETIEVVVLGIEVETRRISLGAKQLTVDPWILREPSFTPGTRVVGRVATVVPFGAFLEVEPEMDGLVHLSDISWEEEPTEALKALLEGDDLEVVILSFDSMERRLALGLKQVAGTIPDLDRYMAETRALIAEPSETDDEAPEPAQGRPGVETPARTPTKASPIRPEAA